MDHNLTVSVKSILVAGLVTLALVTAYLLGGSGSAPVSAPASAAPPGQPAAPDDRRLVRMVGTGEASAVPDELSFALSVSAKRVDLDDALGSSTATMKRVLAALKEHGVREADVQTTGLSMHPEYRYPVYSPPVLTGYRVTQRAGVRVRELAQGGKAISAAIESGGNGVRVRGIQLRVGDPDAVLERARDAAVEEATTKAEQYAAATGQALGQVLSIREVGRGSRNRYQPQFGRTLAAYDTRDLSALPLRAGMDELEVRIEVAWAFE
ncbi:MAG: SIMPL domain-containing protein [Nocardioides sp.]